MNGRDDQPEREVLDEIDELIASECDEQGRPLDDYSINRYPKCELCGQSWHGLPKGICPGANATKEQLQAWWSSKSGAAQPGFSHAAHTAVLQLHVPYEFFGNSSQAGQVLGVVQADIDGMGEVSYELVADGEGSFNLRPNRVLPVEYSIGLQQDHNALCALLIPEQNVLAMFEQPANPPRLAVLDANLEVLDEFVNQDWPHETLDSVAAEEDPDDEIDQVD